MATIRAAGVGTLAHAAEADDQPVLVCLLSHRITPPADAETMHATDLVGAAYDVHSTFFKEKRAGTARTVESLPSPPGNAEFLGIYKTREGGDGLAHALAQQILDRGHLSLVLCDGTKLGTGLPRFVARAVAWYVGRQNPKLAKELKRSVPLPKPPWARQALKIMDATKTRAGLRERMEEYYLSNLAYLV